MSEPEPELTPAELAALHPRAVAVGRALGGLTVFLIRVAFCAALVFLFLRGWPL